MFLILNCRFIRDVLLCYCSVALSVRCFGLVVNICQVTGYKTPLFVSRRLSPQRRG